MNCKNCGAILNSDDIFCRQCGQSVNNSQAQNNEEQVFNSYQNNNTTNYQQNNQNNAYQNNSNNSNTSKIILMIVLAIVFWTVGFGLGKLIWENDEKIDINNSQLTQQSTPEANNQSNKNQNSSITNNKTNKNENTSQTNNQARSYIVTDYGMKVYFDVESTLKEDTSSSDEKYRCFEKLGEDDDLTIWIGEEYATMNEYMSDIEDKANRRKQDSEYNNVQLSEVKAKTVNGKEFSFRSLTYNMGDTEFKDLYIAYEIASESLYAIEVEEIQLLTDEELNGLLNITIER